jgi:hypothetical protein
MRADRLGLYLLLAFLGLRFGPHDGQASDAFAAGGAGPCAACVRMLPLGLSALLFGLAWRRIGEAETTKVARAQAVGEP